MWVFATSWFSRILATSWFFKGKYLRAISLNKKIFGMRNNFLRLPPDVCTVYDFPWYILTDHPFSTDVTFSENLTFLTFAYQGVKNVSFSEHFACVLKRCSIIWQWTKKLSYNEIPRSIKTVTKRLISFIYRKKSEFFRYTFNAHESNIPKTPNKPILLN